MLNLFSSYYLKVSHNLKSFLNLNFFEKLINFKKNSIKIQKINQSFYTNLLRNSSSEYNCLNPVVLNKTNNFRYKKIKYLLGSPSFLVNFNLNMSQTNINYFAHSFIDRCSEKRKNKAWIEEQLKSEKSVFVLFHVDKPFVSMDNSRNMYSLCRFNYSQVQVLLEKNSSNETEHNEKKNCFFVFLGVEYKKKTHSDDSNAFENCFSPYSDPNLYDKSDFKSWFAIDTSNFDIDSENIAKLFADYGKFFEGNFLRLMAIQDSLESSIIAQARSILCWIDRNKFCASCGLPNELGDAGSRLSCCNEKCKSNDKIQNKHVPSNIHYPRVDPVVIMLVLNQAKTHFLLGRKKQFPKNMFSCLAGYVEAGESIEEAVRREVFEESGIYTDKVIYHSSQPWPFPSTLMIGCLAYATSNDITIDYSEIEDAKWFPLDDIDQIVKNTHPDKFQIPSERTIAHQLISYYAKNKSKL